MTSRIAQGTPLPNFSINRKKPGILSKIFCSSVQNQDVLSGESAGIGFIFQFPARLGTDTTQICQIIAEQAFRGCAPDFARIACVFAINAMASVKNNKRKEIREAVEKTDNAPFTVCKIGFTWVPQWKPEPYDKARKAYKELRQAKKQALANQIACQETGLEKTVPYNALCERLSDNPATKVCIETLRSSREKRPVYLVFQHAEVVQMWGVVKAYERLFRIHKKAHQCFPDIASTGYHVKSDIPLNELGAELDMTIRSILHQHFPWGGAYFPEPNSACRVPPGKTALPYSFHNKKSREMPAYLKHLIADKGASAAHLAFDPENPVTILSRKRMEATGPSGQHKVFGGRKNAEGKVICWTAQDIKYWRNLPQSHASPRNWVAQVIAAYRHVVKVPLSGTEKYIRALFDLADPIARASQSFDPFPSALKEEVECKAPSLREAATELYRHLQSQGVSKEQSKELANATAKAARKSGYAIADFIEDHLSLDFLELSLGVLEEIYRKEPFFFADSLYGHILHGTVPRRGSRNAFDSKKIQELCDLPIRMDHDLTPLHFAALRGDPALIKELLKIRGAGRLESRAENGIYPLHLALESCLNFGAGPEVIEPLLCAKAFSIALLARSLGYHEKPVEECLWNYYTERYIRPTRTSITTLRKALDKAKAPPRAYAFVTQRTPFLLIHPEDPIPYRFRDKIAEITINKHVNLAAGFIYGSEEINPEYRHIDPLELVVDDFFGNSRRWDFARPTMRDPQIKEQIRISLQDLDISFLYPDSETESESPASSDEESWESDSVDEGGQAPMQESDTESETDEPDSL